MKWGLGLWTPLAFYRAPSSRPLVAPETLREGWQRPGVAAVGNHSWGRHARGISVHVGSACTWGQMHIRPACSGMHMHMGLTSSGVHMHVRSACM